MLNRIVVLLSALVLFYACQPRESNKHVENLPNGNDDYLRVSPDTGVRIFLTFDDGPYQTTPKLTSLLADLKLKASFFIVGSQVTYSTEYDSIFNATKGNKHFRIYNHTFSHAVTKGRIHDYYRSPTNVWDDIEINKKVISTGGAISRLPGKNAWKVGDYSRGLDNETQKFIRFMKENNKNEYIIGWDVEWKLKQSRSRSDVDSLVKEIAGLVLADSSRQKEVVILSHDYLYRTKESLDNFTYFVERLKESFNPSFHWIEELKLIQSK